jgi:UDP-glucose 4-epimerase
VSLIFVTGAHGFIGRNLARKAAALGNVVIGLGHGAWPAAEAGQWGVNFWLNGDVTVNNLQLLQSKCGTPAEIYHLAGGSSVGAALLNPREDFRRTVDGTVELLEWVRLLAAEVSLVAVSSAAVYGAGHSGAISERAAISPYSPYGYHKHIMEELCRSYGSAYGVRTVLPRLFSVYGLGLRKQLLWDICCKLANSRDLELGGDGSELRDWTDIGDVAQALLVLGPAASTSAPAVNVATGRATSVRDIAQFLLSEWFPDGHNGRLRFTGRSRPGDPRNLCADIGVAASMGCKLETPVERGIGEYVRWFKTLGIARQ